MPKRVCFLGLFAALTSLAVVAQTGAAAAAAVGASLAGSATQSGSAASANAAAAAGNASQAPIEVQIMVYGGLKQIARRIADDTSSALITAAPSKTQDENAATKNDPKSPDTAQSSLRCGGTGVVRSVLLQDSTSSAQVAFYKTFDAYYELLKSEYETLTGLLKEKQTAETEKQKEKIEALRQKLHDTRTKLQQLQDQLNSQPPAKPQIKPEDLLKEKGALGEATSDVASADLSAAEIMESVTSAATPGGGTGKAATTGGGGSASGQPLSLQYLSGVGGELTAAKSNMSYTSSSVQALNQALTTELARDLCQNGFELRTSATTLNIDDTVRDIVTKWEELQKDNGDLARYVAWLQKPATTQDQNNNGAGDADENPPNMANPPDHGGKPPKPKPSQLPKDLIATSDGAVLGTSLTNAMTGFQTWLTSGDQMGGIILTDVLKGAQLSKDFAEKKFPALQVSIDAGGGNTRTNSFPFFNFFYLPRPSFNAGVVVTYELRDQKNNFIVGDTKKVLYGYSKWKPEKFCMKEDVNSVELDAGRAVKESGKKCRN